KEEKSPVRQLRPAGQHTVDQRAIVTAQIFDVEAPAPTHDARVSRRYACIVERQRRCAPVGNRPPANFEAADDWNDTSTEGAPTGSGRPDEHEVGARGRRPGDLDVGSVVLPRRSLVSGATHLR